MLSIKFGALDFALPGNQVASIKQAHDIGLDGLELGFFTQGDRAFLLTQRWFRDYYLEEADKLNIELPSMAVCEFDFVGLKNPGSTEKGKRVREITDLAIETAAYMGMHMIMMPSFKDGFIENEEELGYTAEALQYACREAAKKDIVITTENLLTLEKNKELFHLVGEKNFSCLYDSQNYYKWMGWNQPMMLKELIDNGMLYPEIHAKDGVDGMDGSTLLGQGEVDFAGVIGVLKAAEYSGWIHLENFYDKLPLNGRECEPIQSARDDLMLLKDFLK